MGIHHEECENAYWTKVRWELYSEAHKGEVGKYSFERNLNQYSHSYI